MKAILSWLWPVFVVGAVIVLMVTLCASARQSRKQAREAQQQAVDAWNQFVSITNSMATNEALCHTNQPLNQSVVLFFDMRRPITNDVAIKEYGVVFGVLYEGDVSEKHLPVVLSCGHGLVFGPGITIPTNDVPCPCGNTNHWLWKFGKL